MTDTNTDTNTDKETQACMGIWMLEPYALTCADMRLRHSKRDLREGRGRI